MLRSYEAVLRHERAAGARFDYVVRHRHDNNCVTYQCDVAAFPASRAHDQLFGAGADPHARRLFLAGDRGAHSRKPKTMWVDSFF